MVGPSLHQIDFKDFQQLHAVLPSGKECDALLKKQTIKGSVSVDTLVGPARNLYESLNGAKWLFEV